MSNINSENERLLDVVNEQDEVIDLQSRKVIHENGLLRREVHIWLFDKNKNVYFQKSATGRSSAGLFDASIGGHVDSGEDSITAGVREALEESSVSISPKDLVFLTKFRDISRYKNLDIVNNFIRSIYIYKYPVFEEQLKFDPEETDGFHKFSLDFITNMSNEEKKLFHRFVPTHELPYVVEYLNAL